MKTCTLCGSDTTHLEGTICYACTLYGVAPSGIYRLAERIQALETRVEEQKDGLSHTEMRLEKAAEVRREHFQRSLDNLGNHQSALESRLEALEGETRLAHSRIDTAFGHIQNHACSLKVEELKDSLPTPPKEGAVGPGWCNCGDRAQLCSVCSDEEGTKEYERGYSTGVEGACQLEVLASLFEAFVVFAPEDENEADGCVVFRVGHKGRILFALKALLEGGTP